MGDPGLNHQGDQVKCLPRGMITTTTTVGHDWVAETVHPMVSHIGDAIDGRGVQCTQRVDYKRQNGEEWTERVTLWMDGNLTVNVHSASDED